MNGRNDLSTVPGSVTVDFSVADFSPSPVASHGFAPSWDRSAAGKAL